MLLKNPSSNGIVTEATKQQPQQQQQRLNNTAAEETPVADDKSGYLKDVEGHKTHVLDYAPAPGWTVHVTNEGRLYYCNHVTRTASWLPPAEAWKTGEDRLPYGWERAIDDTGRSYYINHVNKTTTYETPAIRCTEPLPAPEPRTVTLERSPQLGFGFVAGSEKPVIVRFVTEGGPSVDKLLPGDQILAVNGEDVKSAPREHVISLVRACTVSVVLVVCQPSERQGARKSTLLSASKRARLRTKPSRVRFAESVCVNGAPLFPPSAFSLGDICVPPMANVLKVFLENGQTKSFKYDAWTTVKDVVKSLEDKLCLTTTEHFSLVVEHIKSLKRNKLTLLDPNDTLAKIASRPGAHKLRCLYRVAFVPSSAATLAQSDLSALDYLYTQCCNDVIQERFSPELQYDTALRLAALHIYQHALANNIPAIKLTIKTIEKDFGLERFVPGSILEKMKRKEIRKLLSHFLKLHANMAGPGKQLTALQAKLHYLDIVGQLPSYGAKCFSCGPRGDAMERVILVSPKFGISQIVGTRNSMPLPIANIEDMKGIEIKIEDELSRAILIHLRPPNNGKNDRIVALSLEERDSNELVLVLTGYYRLLTDQTLPVNKDDALSTMATSSSIDDDMAPPFLQRHKVVPEKWSYIDQNQIKTISFALQPIYQQNVNRKTNGLYNTMGRQAEKQQHSNMIDKQIRSHQIFAESRAMPLKEQKISSGFAYNNNLDSNMNTSMSNKNHQRSAFNKTGFDYDFFGTISSTNSLTEAKNEEMLKRVKEMEFLVESSQKYLNEQEESIGGYNLAEWQETSVDIDSDNDEIVSNDDDTSSLLLGGRLKHSDSLLLLTKGHSHEQLHQINADAKFSHAAIELLRSETNQSESDNDSLYTPPHNSPKLKEPSNSNNNNSQSRISFGLRSPDNGISEQQDLQDYLIRRQMNGNEDDDEEEEDEEEEEEDDTKMLYVFDPDLIDLTLLPPPITPDELDGALPPSPAAINMPPSSFADSLDKLNKLGVLHENLDLEEFLASFTVPPPTQKVTPAIELTPEEIMSYIIPPPPETLLKPVDEANDGRVERLNGPIDLRRSDVRRSSNCSNKSISKSSRLDVEEKKNVDETTTDSSKVIEYATVDRRSPFTSCCSSKDKKSKTEEEPIRPLPRRSSDEKPPERPPKNLSSFATQERQRSQSLGTSSAGPPKLPPKGKGVQLKVVPIQSPISPIKTCCSSSAEDDEEATTKQGPSTPMKQLNNNNGSARAFKEQDAEPDGMTCCLNESCCSQQHHQIKNGCTTTRANLLTKTDAAMASLSVRLDQIAAQCNTAQTHGGGRLMSEDKFQTAKEELTAQSLQLVHSSKMLVIAMSDPTLPDLPENLAVCLTILRRLTELCQDLSNYTTSPLQTRNVILKVHDVTSAFRHLITADIDRTSQRTIEEHLAGEAERLANVLTILLRSLRVFSP